MWGALATDLEAHLAFEEDVIFPAYAKQSPACRDLVKRLVAEHAVIRELFEEIGVTIQLHAIRAWTIEVLVELLREHAAVENERIYPWVALEARTWAPRSDGPLTGAAAS